ncbi:MAG: hypothetical protein J6D19_05470 [Clostridia bacterium]|nr:hypothetical protein [Clostridia bacterium]
MKDFIDKLDFFRTDSDAMVSIQFIIMALAFGLIIAFIAVYYQRRVIGSFVRAIRSAEAIDEESAKTLAELGQENNVSAIAKLKKSASLRNLVTICDMKTEANGKIIIDDSTRFYIAKEKEERSRKQFGDNEDSLIPIILGSLALLVVVVLSFFIGK